MRAAVLRFVVSRALASFSGGRLLARRHARAPLVGYLERLEADGTVGGWLLGSADEVPRMTARVDGGVEQVLALRGPRTDVERAFARPAIGFGGVLRIDSDAAKLEIWAEWHERRCLVFRAPLRGAPAGQRACDRWWQIVRDRGARRAFDQLVRRAAGEEFPRVVRALPHLFAALRADARLQDQPFHELRRRLYEAAPAPRPRGPMPPGRLRILVVSGVFPSVWHGGGLRLFDLLTKLGERHEIDLYSAFDEMRDADSLALLRPHLRAIGVASSLEATEVERWLTTRGRSRGEYDVASFEFSSSALLVRPLRRWARRAVFTMMESGGRARLIDLDRALAATGRVAAATRALADELTAERQAVRHCDVAIAVTDTDAAFAARAYGCAPPDIIPTCVSPRLSAPLNGLPDDLLTPPPPVALFVGYYDHRPNRDALLWYLERVHGQVAARVPGYRLRVVGRGDLADVTELCAKTPAVDLIGEVDDLAPELRGARVGLAPIVSGAGIRGKVNQYAAFARPTVSTSAGAAGLPYRQGESIFLADDPGAFADAVTRLLVDDVVWRALAVNCHALVRTHFTWTEWVPRLEAIYRR